MASISIVIVNWNSGKYLESCISSILQNNSPLINEIIIIDNNSSDGSINKIQENTKIRLIKSSENLGFAKACNLGASYATSEFILFLNPDTLFLNNPLNEILNFLGNPKNSQVGICGIKLIDEDQQVSKSCSRFPSLKSLFIHSIGLNNVFKIWASPMLDFDHQENLKVDQVIGAFFFVRRHIFKELNGFDERFYVYYEEVDFSLRAKNIGYSSYFLADSVAMHAGGGSSKNVKSLR